MREFAARELLPNALFAIKYVHDARFSPDGRRVAILISRTDPTAAQEFFELTVMDLVLGVRHDLEFPGNVSFPRWAPDGSCLIFIGTQGSSRRLYRTDPDLNQTFALTPEGCQVQGPSSWSPDARSVAFTVITRREHSGIRRFTKRVFRSEGLGIVDDLMLAIHVVAIEGGNLTPIKTDRTFTAQPSFSPCGRQLLFLGADSAVGYESLGGLTLCTVDLVDGRTVKVLDDRWFVASAAWSPCGQRIVVAGAFESTLTVPTVGLWVVDRDGLNPQCRTLGLLGNVGLRVHHDMPTWDTSQNNCLSVPEAGHAYASVARRGCTEIWRIALTGEISFEPAISGPRSCVIFDSCARTSQLLYAASDLSTPWDLYVFNPASGEEKRLTQLNESVLEKWPKLRVEHLNFASGDGLPLEGWFLARADRRGPQPTVLFIHGGPFLATGYAFRFDFHLLAANGFAVVFANFRGSAGYGEPFVRGIMDDWGARGFADHMAAVDAVVERGLSDPKRIGVWGPSHGGFATAWMVTHTHRFRAAVAESAVTNFSTLYYLCDAPDMFIRTLGGKPHEIPDVYRSRSPITYASRCRTPTLMLHGEKDLRCPVAEAEQFYRALHDAGCTTELIEIPEMTHMGDSTGPLSVREAQNEALLDWFERYL